LIYGVYSKKDTVTWSPEMIFSKELRILGSFSQINCFPRAVAYLDNKKVRTAEMVTDV
jgi:D-arabinitol dehydrogenase (NADP+)